MYKEWENRSLETNFKTPRDIIVITILVIFYFFLRLKVITKLCDKLLSKTKLTNDERKNVKTKYFGSLYRFVIYTTLSLYGICVLWNEEWLFKSFKYTLTWKNNETPLKIIFYYQIEIAHYIASTLYLFREPKMSDFYQMLLHHFITLILMIFSFHRNLLRYGVSIMLLHDIADPFMEGAKLLFYSKYQKTADRTFCLFALIFIISRCFFYPIGIVIPATYFTFMHGMRFSYAVQVISLMLLLILNLIWSFYISKMVISYIRIGKVKGDIRTDEVIDKKIK